MVRKRYFNVTIVEGYSRLSSSQNSLPYEYERVNGTVSAGKDYNSIMEGCAVRLPHNQGVGCQNSPGSEDLFCSEIGATEGLSLSSQRYPDTNENKTPSRLQRRSA